MSGFAPKDYQQQVLESVQAYFQAGHELERDGLQLTQMQWTRR
jgi:hypothetical protein